jgi:hypothetical protein
MRNICWTAGSLPDIDVHGLYRIKSAVPSSVLLLPADRQRVHSSVDRCTSPSATHSGQRVDPDSTTQSAEPNATANDTLEWNLTIGGDRWPSFNRESVQGGDAMYRLRLATSSHLGNDLFNNTDDQITYCLVVVLS